MLRTVASKVMWVGRATVFVVGLAVILALVLGVASTALGSNGQAFSLGRINVASAVSTLVKQGPGPALDLQVDSGPPLAVNSSTKVTNLNADQLDGKDSGEFAAKTESPGADSTTLNDAVSLLTNSVKNVTSVTLTAPADGFVIVTGSGTFDTDFGLCSHVSGTQDFMRAFLSRQSATSDSSTLEFLSVPASAPSGEYSAPFSITRMYPVTAGEQTFYLTADKAGTDSCGAITRANITAVFVKNQL